MDKNAITLGLQIGRIISGQRRKADRVPVAYLYGKSKVPLPKLPEWDKTKYPYAVMWTNEDAPQYQVMYGLYATSTPSHRIIDQTDGDYAVGVQAGETYLVDTGIWFPVNGSYINKKFDAMEEVTPETANAFTSYPKWANYDVLNPDGTVWLEGSDPVPVYE